MVPGELSLDALVRARSILVCCGSGGVGKTTTAAALALRAAEVGRRAVVVTIDPAKRLADTLGIEGIGNDAHRIDGPWTGELWALMLDTKGTFDDVVSRYAASAEQRDRILTNRFYRNISSSLSGTQEYMAAEKLYELHESGAYDLVVVDTPPTRNALDFLDAPGRLVRFLDHRLFRALLLPSRGPLKALNLAAQSFVRTVARVVGAEVIDDAIAFFQAFEGMEHGFRSRADRVAELLTAPGTAYVLVASPKRETVDEASYFATKLADHGITVDALVLNRLLPRFTDQLPEAVRARAETLAGTELGALYANLADFALVAAREDEHVAPLVGQVAPAPVVRVPMLRADVHDLEALDLVGAHLFA